MADVTGLIVESRRTLVPEPAVVDRLNWVAGEFAVYEGLILFKRGDAIHMIGTATHMVLETSKEDDPW